MESWQVPNMWEGGDCWIIGGGPSMPREFGVPEDVIQAVASGEQPLSAFSPYLSCIHDKHVIGINVAFLLGNWVDILFFGDGHFFEQNKEALADFPKVKLTCHSGLSLKLARRDNVKYIPANPKHTQGICTARGSVAWNFNSGAAAISLAVQLGVKKVYLLGFDMNLGEDKRKHWHGQYLHKYQQKQPFKKHLMGFPKIARDAKNLGVEIINVSRTSAITEFPKMSLKEVI